MTSHLSAYARAHLRLIEIERRWRKLRPQLIARGDYTTIIPIHAAEKVGQRARNSVAEDLAAFDRALRPKE